MTDEPETNAEDLFDAYVDGLLSDAKRAAFELRVAGDSRLAQQLELHEQIQLSVQRQFPIESAPEDTSAVGIQGSSQDASLRDGEETLRRPLPTTASGSNRRMLAASLVGLAAAAAAWVVVWQGDFQSVKGPFFQPRSVAAVYQETLANGFEPYYECRDDQRFRDVFQRRQGIALRLAELPLGSTMLGLSYSGGLSRETTGMLCRVDQQPLMVFVDRIANDFPDAARSTSDAVHIHRVVRDGLVFYEVSPFDVPRMIDFLIVAH